MIQSKESVEKGNLPWSTGPKRSKNGQNGLL